MSKGDPLLRRLSRFGEEGVEYVLVGDQAVRLNGFLGAPEDVNILVRPAREKDLLDRKMLEPVRQGLGAGE